MMYLVLELLLIYLGKAYLICLPAQSAADANPNAQPGTLKNHYRQSF
jgi:hypothetical protein